MEMRAEMAKHGENGCDGGKTDKETAKRKDGEEVKNKGQMKTKYRDKRKKMGKESSKAANKKCRQKVKMRAKKAATWPDKHKAIYAMRAQAIEASCKLKKKEKKARCKKLLAKSNWFHYKPNKRSSGSAELRKKRVVVKQGTPRWCMTKGYRRLRIATANPGGLNGKFNELQMAKWASQHKLDIVGVQETQIPRDTETKVGKYMIINSACRYGGGSSKVGGVALMVHERMQGLVSEVERKGHRLLRVKLRKTAKTYAALDITVAYAPHSGYEDAERDSYWAELEAIEAKKKKSERNLRVLLTDANGEISRGDKGNLSKWRRYVGKSTRCKQATKGNGIALRNLLRKHDLFAANTFNQTAAGNKTNATFELNGKLDSKQLDYIGISLNHKTLTISIINKMSIKANPTKEWQHNMVIANLGIKWASNYTQWRSNRADRRGADTYDVKSYRLNGEATDEKLRKWAESGEAMDIYKRIALTCSKAKKGMTEKSIDELTTAWSTAFNLIKKKCMKIIEDDHPKKQDRTAELALLNDLRKAGISIEQNNQQLASINHRRNKAWRSKHTGAHSHLLAHQWFNDWGTC